MTTVDYTLNINDTLVINPLHFLLLLCAAQKVQRFNNHDVPKYEIINYIFIIYFTYFIISHLQTLNNILRVCFIF